MLLSHGGVLACNVMTRGQQLATYWSAIVHDFQHGGLNNDFLIKSLHPLALLYNDQSPLENHHLSSSMRLMHQPEHMFMVRSFALSVSGVLDCAALSRIERHESHCVHPCVVCFVSCAYCVDCAACSLRHLPCLPTHGRVSCAAILILDQPCCARHAVMIAIVTVEHVMRMPCCGDVESGIEHVML